jgi:hypothetical protein
MNHVAELALHTFLQKALAGNTTVDEAVIEQVGKDVADAVRKQFSSGSRDEFKLRMSNLGRPKCQLWYEKNDPEDKTPFPPHFLVNMMLGDIVEAVFKGLLRAAAVEFTDNEKVVLTLSDGTEINGEYDMVLDGKVDDVKSASPWSYQHKFSDFETLSKGDTFGYVSQLVGYAVAAGKEVGGWWVINKANGEFKYVDANGVDVPAQIQKIEETVKYIHEDKPFERCFEAIPETYRKKASGNLKLGTTCGFCAYKHKCWPGLQTLPSRVSTAKELPMVDYVFIGDGLDDSKEA